MFFRDQLRRARDAAHKDAEGFTEICRALEQLAKFLGSRANGLGGHREKLTEYAFRHARADEREPAHVAEFETTFRLLVDGRNSSAHEGAYARNVTRHAKVVACVLEEALQMDMLTVEHFMVPDPLCAHSWEPIAHVRQRMLSNSFSFLPIRYPDGGAWHVLADVDVASFLRRTDGYRERRRRLTLPVQKALETGLALRDGRPVHPSDKAADVAQHLAVGPALVVSEPDPGRLLGILTAFDLL